QTYTLSLHDALPILQWSVSLSLTDRRDLLDNHGHPSLLSGRRTIIPTRNGFPSLLLLRLLDHPARADLLEALQVRPERARTREEDRKSTRLNSSHVK